MNPDLATFLTGLACLAIGWLAFDLLIHRPSRAADDDLRKIIAAQKDIIWDTEERADLAEHSRDAADQMWRDERTVHAVTMAERDMFEAAFTAEMLRQARAELLRPDEASGLATVHEIKAGRS